MVYENEKLLELLEEGRKKDILQSIKLLKLLMKKVKILMNLQNY